MSCCRTGSPPPPQHVSPSSSPFHLSPSFPLQLSFSGLCRDTHPGGQKPPPLFSLFTLHSDVLTLFSFQMVAVSAERRTPAKLPLIPRGRCDSTASCEPFRSAAVFTTRVGAFSSLLLFLIHPRWFGLGVAQNEPHFTVVLMENGDVFTFGYGQHGQLGHGDVNSRYWFGAGTSDLQLCETTFAVVLRLHSEAQFVELGCWNTGSSP